MLVPELRLFMSVDLAGFTAYKYNKNTESSESEIKRSEWKKTVQHFFAVFQETLHTNWVGELKQAINPYSGYSKILKDWPVDKVSGCPTLWKPIGDELVFAKKLNTPLEAVLALHAFKESVASYDNYLMSNDKGNLGVKGTAWLAGFPILNQETRLDWLEEANKDEDIFEVQGLSSKAWKPENPITDNDFVGISMDIGFRLAGRATRRKLVLSADLAWMILEVMDEGGKAFDFMCDEPEALKGVLENDPYPTVWIDMGSKSNRKHEREATRRSTSPPGALKTYLLEFLSDQKNPLVLPYIHVEGVDAFKEMPKEHREELKKMNDNAKDTLEHVDAKSFGDEAAVGNLREPRDSDERDNNP